MPRAFRHPAKKPRQRPKGLVRVYTLLLYSPSDAKILPCLRIIPAVKYHGAPDSFSKHYFCHLVNVRGIIPKSLKGRIFMPNVGIIAEYNPFHNGHALQIREIKRRIPDAGIVVAMSGSFTQRGSAAILDKWHRAAAVVRHGASLVLELPSVFATRSAQYFAEGGVRLLDRLGAVDTLAFGTECEDLSLLKKLARDTSPERQQKSLKARLHGGATFAEAITESAPPEATVRQPNVILAMEYLRAIAKFDALLSPMPLPRFAANHSDETLPRGEGPSIAGGSAIRASLFASLRSGHPIDNDALNAVPRDVGDDILSAASHGYNDTSKLFLPALSHVFASTPESLRSVADMGEGMERRLIRAAASSQSYDEFINALRTKRYQVARTRRLLLHILMRLTKEDVEEFDETGPLYARVLAFDEKGREILRKIKKDGKIPVVTKLSKVLPHRGPESASPSAAQKMTAFDLRASALASLTSSPPGFPPANADYLMSPKFITRDSRTVDSYMTKNFSSFKTQYKGTAD